MLRHTKLLLLFGILLSFLSGCQLFKRTTTDNNAEKLHFVESMDLIEQETYNEQQMSAMLSVKNDSTSSQTLLTIWPRGSFKFSTDSGFTGAAERIQVATTNKTGAVQTTLETVKRNAGLQADRKIATKALVNSSNTKKTKMSRPEALPYLVIGIVITAIAIVLIGFLSRKAN